MYLKNYLLSRIISISEVQKIESNKMHVEVCHASQANKPHAHKVALRSVQKILGVLGENGVTQSPNSDLVNRHFFPQTMKFFNK